jgi:hypothetical protein
VKMGRPERIVTDYYMVRSSSFGCFDGTEATT